MRQGLEWDGSPQSRLLLPRRLVVFGLGSIEGGQGARGSGGGGDEVPLDAML